MVSASVCSAALIAECIYFPGPYRQYELLQILFTDELWVPLVVLDGVHILPGIPRLFKQMIEGNLSSLPTGPAYVRHELYTHMAEGDLSETLSQIAEKWPQVSFISLLDVAC